MTTVRILFLAGILGASPLAFADCFATASAHYHLNETLLRVIALGESGNRSDAVHVNRDGSRDIGVMQINSTHLAWLATRHITEAALHDRCTNITVGAYLLADLIRQYGPTWRSVGAYGAGTRMENESARQGYATKVAHAFTTYSRALTAVNASATLRPTPASLRVTE